MTQKTAAQKKPQRAKDAPHTREERRARILEAALREFVSRGFEAASTNTIALDAKVAKGLLFHHFGNKEELFLAVFEEVIARVVRMLTEGYGPEASDLFERLHIWAMRKFRAFQRDPLAYQFLVMAIGDAPPALRARIEQQQAALSSRFIPLLLDGIDASRLRPGVSLTQAIETITLLSEGIMHHLMPRLVDLPDKGASQLEEIRQASWKHFAFLRDGLYQP